MILCQPPGPAELCRGGEAVAGHRRCESAHCGVIGGPELSRSESAQPLPLGAPSISGDFSDAEFHCESGGWGGAAVSRAVGRLRAATTTNQRWSRLSSGSSVLPRPSIFTTSRVRQASCLLVDCVFDHLISLKRSE